MLYKYAMFPPFLSDYKVSLLVRWTLQQFIYLYSTLTGARGDYKEGLARITCTNPNCDYQYLKTFLLQSFLLLCFCDVQGCTSAGGGAPGMAYMPNSWCESTRRQIKEVHRIQTEGQHQQGKGIVNNDGSERLLRGRTMYLSCQQTSYMALGGGV